MLNGPHHNAMFLVSNLFFCVFLFQLRAVDEMNYDFQALALESRGMGEVRDVGASVAFTSPSALQNFFPLLVHNHQPRLKDKEM